MKNIEEDLALVLTATVRPAPGLSALARTDVLEREMDYIKALDYYLHNQPRIRNVVLVENSGWPLDKFREAAARNPQGKHVEIISLSKNDFPPELGKSYGELSLLKHGLSASTTLLRTRYFAKVTGRLVLRNATRLLEGLPDELDLACDLRDHPLYEILRIPACGRHADTRFLVFHRAFFLNCVDNGLAWVNDSQGRLVESWIYELAKSSPNRRIIRRFPIEPQFQGVSGALNRPYGSGADRAKTLLRAASRRIIPWMHI